jgi:hypothetical protein
MEEDIPYLDCASELVEEAYIELSKNLFETSKSQNKIITKESDVPLKTKQDHVLFAKKCSEKLEKSTSLHTKVFYQSLTDHISNRLSADELNLIIIQLQNIVTEKNEKIKKKPEAKKQTKKESKNYDDVFGKSDDIDIYDELYGDLQDKYI